MRRSVHLLLLAAPVLLFYALLQWAHYRSDTKILDANGMTWGTGASQLSAQTHSTWKDRETEDILARITDQAGHVEFEDRFVVDWDMWGWGFVKAVQMDSDPELEILFMDFSGRRQLTGQFPDIEPKPYYLDMSSGHVEKKMDFTAVAGNLIGLLNAWETANKPLTKAIWLLMYYVIGYPALLVIFWATRRLGRLIRRFVT